MKAAVYRKYGPPEVIRVEEMPKPEPRDDQVLIRVLATSLNSADVRLRKADPFLVRLFFGLFRPNTPILGTDVAGIVESVGSQVRDFRTGDAVFGSTYDSGMAAHAEYAVISENSVLALKPENVSFEEAAAAFFGGHTALHFLRKGNAGAGQRILIYGASGSVGTSAVQLARYFGAEVHAVTSGRNVSLVRSLGASKIFDYQKEDFSRSGTSYEVIFDTVGKSPFHKCIGSLTSEGRYLRAVHSNPGALLAGFLVNLTSGKRVIGGVAHEKKEDLLLLKQLLEEGYVKPLIDRIYQLKDIAEAHRYVDTGRKRGNVVIQVSSE